MEGLCLRQNDGGPKPRAKLKADGRFCLLHHASRATLDNDELDAAAVNFLQQRAALRLRTLRFIFCSPTFTNVLFDVSAKGRTEEAHVRWGRAVDVESARIGQVAVCLTEDHLSPASVVRVLRVARLERIAMVFSSLSGAPNTHAQLRAVFPIIWTLKEHRSLKAIKVYVSGNDASNSIVRDFWSEKIAKVRMLGTRDSIVLQYAPSIPLESVHIAAPWGCNHYLGSFFRARARVLQLHGQLESIAEHGPCAQNEAVERVFIRLYGREMSTVLFEYPADLPWGEENTRNFRAAFKNLHSLNETFTVDLELLTCSLCPDEAADPTQRPHIIASLERLVDRSLLVVRWAEEAGVRLAGVRTRLGWLGHSRDLDSALRALHEYFAQAFVAQNEDFDEELLEQLDLDSPKELLCLWMQQVGATNVCFVFVNSY
ncbi:hypothetical protein M3Y99_01004400 [Aphelenchoides fujianensis]|nr:hypothetical protein M3Y99_01004400 [Aphelenchoides fujianensis]